MWSTPRAASIVDQATVLKGSLEIVTFVFVTRFAKRGLIHAHFQVSFFPAIQQIQQ